MLSYGRAGRENGYFATERDAEIFEQELTWMLLHQVFSFNSPVWFNVGTASPQQVSACFILSVDDTMDSILNWYREEGLIFKGGSGAGLNLSRIRSSKELLSSGGTASGPVSFMRGADASAGTIKSGGATRRAAKMVVLDVDHPDIEEFIETKVREEEKIRVLRDAGFDMDLGGKDITSVQYQNANNSVRVSDEFMRAVEEGREFGLRARGTGEVIETVDAKALFRQMAEAAWACADPGIQYDDTINDWHTNPETGRITASNPCSEYMSLDNSSCNLASLNLLKFLNDDDRFDVAAVRAVRRAHHHRDGHLHLLRRLPDRGDRGHHAQVPAAGHRLREPRRPADGDRAGLRLRRRAGARGGDHQPHDGHGVPALGRAGVGGGSRTRATPATRGPYPGDAQARRGHRLLRTHSSLDGDVLQLAGTGLAGGPRRSARRTAGATPRPPCWRRPGRSAS